MDSATTKSLFEQVLAAESGRMVILSQTPVMSAAVNDNGRAALFVRATLTPSQVVSDGQGFSVKTTRSGENDYVQITAVDRGIPPLFLKLTEYILERLSSATSTDEGVAVLVRSIDEYRRFVGQPRGRLPENVVRGTFAELLFLRTVIDAGLGAEEAVAAWRGPWARAGLGVHDFTFPDGRGVEVKSTHQPPGAVRVSSPAQLVPTSEPLDLLVLPVEDAPDGAADGVAFRDFVRDTGEIMTSASPLAAELWGTALDALHLELSDDWYDRYRFVPGEWRRFRVVDGFPHLDISSLPAGLIDVRYSLELARLEPFVAPYISLFGEMGLS